MAVYFIRCLIEGLWCGLTFFFSMVILIGITKYLIFGEGKNKIGNWIIGFALTTIYCNTLTALLMSIGLLYSSTVQHVELENDIYRITHGISIVTYSIAQTTVYLFFTHRCQSSFKGTIYASKPCVYITLYVMIMGYIVTQLSFVIFTRFIEYNYFIVGTISSGITVLIDSIGSISMLILFVTKTFDIIVMNKSASYDQPKISKFIPRSSAQSSQVIQLNASMGLNQNDDNGVSNNCAINPKKASPSLNSLQTIDVNGVVPVLQKSESRWDLSVLERRNSFIDTRHLNERQKRLLYINIKITLLSIIIMISYQIYMYICWSYNILGIDFKHWLISKPIEDRFFYINISFWMIDCGIGSLCVYLNFKKTDPIYWILCSKCHLCFNQCCERMAHQRIREKSIEPKEIKVRNIIVQTEDDD